MDPQTQFCHNRACPARGQRGQGNIVIHSQKEARYQCTQCGATFSETKATLFYRRRYPPLFMSQMLSLLAHGCPPQAIVATFAVDARTVAAWQRAAGEHCRQVHEAVVQQGRLDLGQVQADELRVKTQAGIFWMALAITVSTRLWLGGVVSASRDRRLALALALQVKACALCRPLLICFDGWAAYVAAFQQALRSPRPNGKRGHPRLVAWPDIALGQVVKQYVQRRVVGIQRRIVQGSEALVTRLLKQSQGGGVLNTAYSERLNATFRERLAVLVRRSRALARTPETLAAGMYLLGCVYNFCSWHASLRLPLYVGRRCHWVKRTPAMAAGLTDHCWSVQDLFSFKIAPPPYVPPKRRGRPPKAVALARAAWA